MKDKKPYVVDLARKKQRIRPQVNKPVTIDIVKGSMKRSMKKTFENEWENYDINRKV
jgi:hypothetical protein